MEKVGKINQQIYKVMSEFTHFKWTGKMQN